MTKTIFSECREIVKDLVGQDSLYFDHAVEVKISPHSMPFHVWAVAVSPKDEFYVMDSDQQWHQVELDDSKGSLVIGSLYQRLKLMRIHYRKAS